MSGPEDLTHQLVLMVKKANRAIVAAKRQVEEGDYDFASSRAYYAAFYALQAVLLTKELSFSKHAGVLSAFNRYFVKPQTFPKEFSGLISRLFRERHMADYEFDLSISESEARKDIQAAQTILQAIVEYLRHQGFGIG